MQYWKRTDAFGKIVTVEAYSHNLDIENAIKITQAEYEDFIQSLPSNPAPVDFKAQYQAAATIADKVDVLARRLGIK